MASELHAKASPFGNIPGLINHDGAVYELRRWVLAAGTQKKAAKTLGVSAQYIDDVLAGRCEIGPTLAEAMGMRKIVMFEEIKK